jgi:hypothetical protein
VSRPVLRERGGAIPLRYSPVDTVGESFELNIAAAQEAETLTGTAKPIILAQGPVRGKWDLGYSNTA